MNYGDPGWDPIPGAAHTKVEWMGQFVAMRNGTWKAQVNADGSILITRDSRKEAESFMKKDEARTQELLRWFHWAHVRDDRWLNTLRRWVHKDAGPGPSVKNWYPNRFSDWKMGKFQQGNTSDLDLPSAEWLGTVFEYTHFVDDDGRDGLIVMWHEGGDARSGYMPPEVWMGNVEAFMLAQKDGIISEDMEVLDRWNDRFENGIVWAFDKLGLFEKPSRRDLPKSMRALIRRRPELLEKARAA